MKTKQFFRERVEVDSLTGCWNWTKALDARDNRGQYARGVYKEGSRTVKAHRGVWEAWFGPIPKGLAVLHECDNARCVNPAHLSLGTHADNMRDMVRRGRSNAGARHPLSKLTVAGVAAIRRKLMLGVRGTEIAAMYGVSTATISSIKHNTRWPIKGNA